MSSDELELVPEYDDSIELLQVELMSLKTNLPWESALEQAEKILTDQCYDAVELITSAFDDLGFLRFVMLATKYVDQPVVYSRTPLMIAVNLDRTDVVDLLLSEFSLSTNPLSIYRGKAFDVEEVVAECDWERYAECDEYEHTVALEYAIFNRNYSIIERLGNSANHHELPINVKRTLVFLTQLQPFSIDLVRQVLLIVGDIMYYDIEQYRVPVYRLPNRCSARETRQLVDLMPSVVVQQLTLPPTNGAKVWPTLHLSDSEYDLVWYLYEVIDPTLKLHASFVDLILAACANDPLGRRRLYSPNLFDYVCVQNRQACEAIICKRGVASIMRQIVSTRERQWRCTVGFVSVFGHLTTIKDVTSHKKYTKTMLESLLRNLLADIAIHELFAHCDPLVKAALVEQYFDQLAEQYPRYVPLFSIYRLPVESIDRPSSL